MKTKLLFAAVLMAASTGGAQAVWAGESTMLLQLLENQWQGVSLLAEEDKERPAEDNTDVTKWIVNPNFDDATDALTGWTYGVAPLNYDQQTKVLNTPVGVIRYETNVHTSLFEFSQTISDVPNGIYRASVQQHSSVGDQMDLFLRSSFEGSSVRMNWNFDLTVNDDNAAELWADGTRSRTYTGEVLVVDGALTLGANYFKAAGNSIWFTHFKLEYVNDGLERIKELYNEQKAIYDGIDEDCLLDYYKEQLSPISSLNPSDEDVDSYYDAYNMMLPIVSNCAEVAGLVRELKDLEAKATSMLNTSTIENVELRTALENACQTAAAWESAETVEAVQGMYNALQDAYIAYALLAIPTGEVSWDFTCMIQNPDFDDNNADGWSGDKPGKTVGGVPEFWNTSFSFNQTLTDLPNGKYKIDVQARHFGNEGYLYATGATTVKQAITATTVSGTDLWNGNLGNEAADMKAERESGTDNSRIFVEALVVDGSLTFGMAADAGGTWVVFDDFHLTYLGQDLDAYKSSLDEANAEASALAVTMGETLPEGYRSTLSTAVDYSGFTTAAQYEEALAQKRAMIDNAEETADVYAEYQEKLSFAKTMQSALESSDENEQEFADAVNSNAINIAGDLAAVKAAYDALWNGMMTYLEVSSPVDDVPFDITSLFMVNTDVTGMNVWIKLPEIGWSTDMNEGNQQTNNDRNEAGTSQFIEVWTGSTAQVGWILYQNVALPKGHYQLSADAFASAPSEVCLYAGETKGDQIPQTATVFGSKANLSVAFESWGEAMRLGLKGEPENASGWCGLNNMKLYKMPMSTLQLDEFETYSVTSDTYANVTMTRSMQEKVGDADKWNTFCVPFDMTPEQLTSNHISEVRTFDQVNVEGDAITLNSAVVNDGVKAGVPYLVKVDQDIETITVEDVTVTAANPEPQRVGFAGEGLGYVEMTGNYSAGTVPTGAYFINNNVFYLADEAASVSLKGFRAYITIVDEAGEAVPSQVNRLLIDIDGEVTAIEDVLGESAADSAKAVDVYTLSGVKVKSGVKKSEALDGLQRGIYIVDGQKMTK